MTELIHSTTLPQFRLINPPLHPMLMPVVTDTTFLFDTMCTTYKMTPIDERGVLHHTEHGRALQYESKYRLRIDLDWDYVKVGKVDGGTLEPIDTSNKNEYEFLTYLLNYKHRFSYNGLSELYLVLNHVDGSTAADPAGTLSGTDDREYRVIVLGGIDKRSNPAEIHGFTLALETIDFVDYIPYTIAYNHDRSR